MSETQQPSASNEHEEIGTVVIVGASLAGASAAVALREQGFQGIIELIGEEPHSPYERPPLSKALLLGDADEPDWVKPADYYPSHQISWVANTLVTQIRPAEQVVVTGNSEHSYDRLLLATGSSPRLLRIPGSELRQILTLRTLDDALMMRDSLRTGGRVAIVGAGWIGCEVAAAARKYGADVVMIDPLSQPLVRVLGEQVGQVFADLHREHGVDLRLGVGVSGFEEGPEGRLSGVRLSDGSLVEAELVVLGVGVQPRIELAEEAGLELAGGGVAVNSFLQTSDPLIYAVGDIAAHDHPRLPGRVRVEHWANAKDQGTHVATNLLGGSEPYAASPFFFSDQYDLGCEYRGLADPENDELVIRGDLQARDFTAIWLRDGAVTAAMNVNQWDDGDDLQRLVDTGARVSASDLAAGRFSVSAEGPS
jgi:NADPH-dependent 2,4-dienoyl-CoA reductase/sulfur reductase-like enzyme